MKHSIPKYRIEAAAQRMYEIALPGQTPWANVDDGLRGRYRMRALAVLSAAALATDPRKKK